MSAWWSTEELKPETVQNLSSPCPSIGEIVVGLCGWRCWWAWRWLEPDVKQRETASSLPSQFERVCDFLIIYENLRREQCKGENNRTHFWRDWLLVRVPWVIPEAMTPPFLVRKALRRLRFWVRLVFRNAQGGIDLLRIVAISQATTKTKGRSRHLSFSWSINWKIVWHVGRRAIDYTTLQQVWALNGMDAVGVNWLVQMMQGSYCL